MSVDLLGSRRGNLLIVVTIAIVFFALRIALLIAREPFFDELFTVWIAAKPLSGILEALRHDSGPPLYYMLVHALGVHGIVGARIVSLSAATATLALLLGERRIGTPRFVAAALLSVYPPAVLFAIDARSYSLCALFITIGLLALRGERVFVAALAFVLAAYTHYYGALFIPLLLPDWTSVGDGSSRSNLAGFRRGGTTAGRLAATGLAVLLFVPGVWLAAHQPREAMRWLSEGRTSWLTNISFAGDYPYGLFAPAAWWLITIAAALLIGALLAPLLPRYAERRTVAGFPLWPAATLVPLLLAMVAGAYFPMRFNAVIAVPLAVWIASASEIWPPAIRRSLVGGLLIVGLVTSWSGIVDHGRRPLDPYRDAALWTRAHVAANAKLVASGYCYLETATHGYPDVIAFPPEQAVHPGWRAEPEPGSISPAPPFIWIGERAAPELSMLRKSHNVQPIYANRGALVAAVR